MVNQLNMTKISDDSSEGEQLNGENNKPINLPEKKEVVLGSHEVEGVEISMVNSSSRLLSVKKISSSKLLTKYLVSSLRQKTFSTNLALFTKTKPENTNSDLFEIGDEIVDPLEWSGSMGWRWYTGFMIFVVIFIMPLIIGFAVTNILQIKNTSDDPSSWWKCGVYCAFIW